MSTNINNLANEIVKELQRYTNLVEEEVEVSKEAVADTLVSELRQDPSPKLTGDYRKGWTKKKAGTSYVVYNKTNYQLTHLLENGHAKAGGGRVEGVPHIRPAEERAIETYLDRVEKAIKR